MDRNVLLLLTYLLKYGVALRKESVDRNAAVLRYPNIIFGSLSARRAWIEMLLPMYLLKYGIVALRKESVDRNASTLLVYLALIRSLSARRAWIEMGGVTHG